LEKEYFDPFVKDPAQIKKVRIEKFKGDRVSKG